MAQGRFQVRRRAGHISEEAMDHIRSPRAKLEAALRAEGIWSPENIRARTFYDVAYPSPPPTLARRVGRAARRLACSQRRRAQVY